jgi:oligopeptide transport system ATP-binding protein
VAEDTALLRVDGLKTHFPIRRGVLRRTIGYVKAVDDVSFAVDRGRTLGLVGESGCGKTTVARSVLRLTRPTAGTIVFDGLPVHSMSARGLRLLRHHMQLIFQDPYGSLNPRMTVESIVGEPLAIMGVADRATRAEMVAELLTRVGLSPTAMRHYPHEFSGGQRQRVGIARALAPNPGLIVCDEPVSALDVSVQAQVINLLADIQEQRGISYLFIAHDLSVVEHIAHSVAVMYGGLVVEMAGREELYRNPLHPYTRELLAAVPVPDPSARARRSGGAEPRDAGPAPEGGCVFLKRCAIHDEACWSERPVLREVGPGHHVRCFRA